MTHQQKIAFGEMRASDPRGLLVYCSGYRCSHLVKLGSAGVGRWSDSVRLSDLEPRFVCKTCGRLGSDIRPDFPPARMGTVGQTQRRPQVPK
ncbi:hypothetical protein [Bradyrhizobium sp.]|uniref:hypothetical protein n=1 Tax=Bradyrhizobium sp. TaxID=376 RepID=UPI00262DA1B8|nr:hypothetical protein [Bradyrhizobium sp.]